MNCPPVLKHFSNEAIAFRNFEILLNSKPGNNIKVFLLEKKKKIKGRKGIGKLMKCFVKEESTPETKQEKCVSIKVSHA